MTNRQRFEALSTADFIEEIRDILVRSSEYFDIEGYLDSEDTDISHFVKVIGTCMLGPSETEIVAYENEQRIAGNTVSEDDIDKYTDEHSRECYIVGETRIFTDDCYILYDIANDRIVKVPYKSSAHHGRKKKDDFRRHKGHVFNVKINDA